jgi:hypothetical protein
MGRPNGGESAATIVTIHEKSTKNVSEHHLRFHAITKSPLSSVVCFPMKFHISSSRKKQTKFFKNGGF